MRILAVATLVGLAACAARSGTWQADGLPLPAQGPTGGATVVVSKTSNGVATVAHFRLDEPGNAMLAEVRDGSVRVLFPPSVDTSMWMRAKVGRRIELSSEAEAVYLITRKGPLDLGVVTEGVSIVDWDARKYARTADPDSAILRFAAEVAGSLYSVTRAAWMVGERELPRRAPIHKAPPECRPEPRPAPKPAPRDTVMRRDDAPTRDPATDRVVCQRGS